MWQNTSHADTNTLLCQYSAAYNPGPTARSTNTSMSAAQDVFDDPDLSMLILDAIFSDATNHPGWPIQDIATANALCKQLNHKDVWRRLCFAKWPWTQQLEDVQDFKLLFRSCQARQLASISKYTHSKPPTLESGYVRFARERLGQPGAQAARFPGLQITLQANAIEDELASLWTAQPEEQKAAYHNMNEFQFHVKCKAIDFDGEGDCTAEWLLFDQVIHGNQSRDTSIVHYFWPNYNQEDAVAEKLGVCWAVEPDSTVLHELGCTTVADLWRRAAKRAEDGVDMAFDLTVDVFRARDLKTCNLIEMRIAARWDKHVFVAYDDMFVERKDFSDGVLAWTDLHRRHVPVVQASTGVNFKKATLGDPETATGTDHWMICFDDSDQSEQAVRAGTFGLQSFYQVFQRLLGNDLAEWY